MASPGATCSFPPLELSSNLLANATLCPCTTPPTPITLATCIKCKHVHPDAILVDVIETGSGPGGMIYTCLEHARIYAQFATAGGGGDRADTSSTASHVAVWRPGRCRFVSRQVFLPALFW